MAWNDDESETVESGALATFSEMYSKNLRALEEAPRRRVMWKSERGEGAAELEKRRWWSWSKFQSFSLGWRSSTAWVISKSSSLGDWLGLGLGSDSGSGSVERWWLRRKMEDWVLEVWGLRRLRKDFECFEAESDRVFILFGRDLNEGV